VLLDFTLDIISLLVNHQTPSPCKIREHSERHSRLYWHDSVSKRSKPLHPRGQPISHSTNRGLSFIPVGAICANCFWLHPFLVSLWFGVGHGWREFWLSFEDFRPFFEFAGAWRENSLTTDGKSLFPFQFSDFRRSFLSDAAGVGQFCSTWLAKVISWSGFVGLFA